MREALECGFSKYPALEGRFPQVSGMQMLMDPSKSPGERLKDLRVKGRRLDNNRIYKLATTSYLSGGGDGCGMAWTDPNLDPKLLCVRRPILPRRC